MCFFNYFFVLCSVFFVWEHKAAERLTNRIPSSQWEFECCQVWIFFFFKDDSYFLFLENVCQVIVLSIKHIKQTCIALNGLLSGTLTFRLRKLYKKKSKKYTHSSHLEMMTNHRLRDWLVVLVDTNKEVRQQWRSVRSLISAQTMCTCACHSPFPAMILTQSRIKSVYLAKSHKVTGHVQGKIWLDTLLLR